MDNDVIKVYQANLRIQPDHRQVHSNWKVASTLHNPNGITLNLTSLVRSQTSSYRSIWDPSLPDGIRT